MVLAKKINKWQYSILGLIFFLPIYLIKIKIGFFSSNLWEIFTLVILIASVFFYKNFLKEVIHSLYEFKWIVFSWMMVIFGLLLASFLNTDSYRNIGLIKGWFIFPFIFTLLTYIFFRKKEYIVVLNVFCLSAGVVSLVGIVYLLMGKLTYDGRLEVFFNSPNYLAMYIAPAIIIGLELFFQKKYLFANKYLSFLYGILLFTCLFLSYSYASWLALALVLIFLFIKNKKKLAIFVFLIIIFLSIVLLISRSSKLYDLVSFDKRSSLASREMIWKSAWKIGKDNWIFGIGPANFQNSYLTYQKYFPPYLEWAVPHPHNLFLAFWLSGGIISLSGFIFLLSLFLIRGKFWKLKSCHLAALGVILYFLIHGLFDTTYFKNDLAVIFWLNYLFAYLGLERQSV